MQLGSWAWVCVSAGGAWREPALGAGRWFDLGLHPPRPWGQRRTEQMLPLSGKRSCARLSQLVGKDKGGRLHPTVQARGCRICATLTAFPNPTSLPLAVGWGGVRLGAPPHSHQPFSGPRSAQAHQYPWSEVANSPPWWIQTSHLALPPWPKWRPQHGLAPSFSQPCKWLN